MNILKKSLLATMLSMSFNSFAVDDDGTGMIEGSDAPNTIACSNPSLNEISFWDVLFSASVDEDGTGTDPSSQANDNGSINEFNNGLSEVNSCNQ